VHHTRSSLRHGVWTGSRARGRLCSAMRRGWAGRSSH